jgi:cobalamin biosynthesis protein CbiD
MTTSTAAPAPATIAMKMGCFKPRMVLAVDVADAAPSKALLLELAVGKEEEGVEAKAARVLTDREVDLDVLVRLVVAAGVELVRVLRAVEVSSSSGAATLCRLIIC